ncbi:diguanylate cyclase [bacterium]|nr:diguanylate cyclase [bacterium]
MSESQRLQALRELDMLDTPAEARFDRLTRLACRLLRCPFAMVSLVDEHRQWFKAAQGHMHTQSPRGESFCNEAIQHEGPLIVPDASADQRFFELPSVQQGIRFYAGIPIRTPDGSAVGTLCVLDGRPRHLETEDLAALQDLAACAEAEIQRATTCQSERELLAEMDQVRRQVSTDEVTRCWNQASILKLAEKERAASKPATLSLCLVVVQNVAGLNKKLGAEAGDVLLREVAERLRGCLRPEELLGRLRGPRFLVLTRTPLAQQQAYGQNLVRLLTSTPVALNGEFVPLVVTIAIVPVREGAEAALARAEKTERGLDPAQNGVALGL